jgi:hypothetical protein
MTNRTVKDFNVAVIKEMSYLRPVARSRVLLTQTRCKGVGKIGEITVIKADVNDVY